MIILLGMPRSGSTWVGKILDSHPSTFYCHEPDTAERLSLPLFPDASDWERHAPELQRLEQRLRGRLPLRVVGKTPLFPKRYRSGIGNRVHQARIWLAKIAGRAGVRPTVPAPAPATGAVTVWKSIESLGRAGVIARALPGAQVVLLVRNPCAYVASVLRGERDQQFTGGDAQSEDYGVFRKLLETREAQDNDLTLAHLESLTPEERLAWRWLLANEKALNDTEGLSQCRTVRYEDICEAPEARGRDLLERAGLSWDPQCAAFLGASTSRSDDRYYAVFKDPARAANRWRDELSHDVIARIARVVSGKRAGSLYPELQGG